MIFFTSLLNKKGEKNIFLQHIYPLVVTVYIT